MTTAWRSSPRTSIPCQKRRAPNKIAPPFRKVEFDILFNRGISKEGELVELGQQAGIVVKSGTWYSMKHPTDGEIRLGQGMERTRQFLMDNPDIAAVIEFFQTRVDHNGAPSGK